MNHFKGGKCKGFQFFQPQNDYEIKLMMEGKIKFNELSNSQRQIDDNFDNLNFNDNRIIHIIHDIPDIPDIPDIRHAHFVRRRFWNGGNRYNRIKCPKKAFLVFIFSFFGNCYFILKGFDLLDNILALMIYILLYISLFFQMIYLNILSLLLILIFLGFKKFILEFENLHKLYLKKCILILVTIFLGTFCRIFYFWKKLIDKTYISNQLGMKILIFFPCAFMSTIINYPLILFINITSIIFIFIFKRSPLSELDINFEHAFNIRINSED